jgi:tetratricopeptide (TPR) repeat protein
VLAFGAILTISSIGLSRILERSEPELSLKLFPFNVEAALASASALAARDPAGGDLKPLEPLALGLLPSHAGDARLYSLIGEIHRRTGDAEAAFPAFERALTLSKTEVNALQWTLQRSLEQGDFPAALDRLDTLFRRWPDRIVPLAPVVVSAFADPGRYPLFLRRVEADPPWRGRLLSALSRTPEAPVFLARLMQDLAAGSTPPRSLELNLVLSALLAAGQYDLAYRTFIVTLTPAEQEVAGHIHNGRFLLPPSGRPFDWQIRNHPGVTSTFRHADGDRPGGGLHLQFANTPIRNLSIRQSLVLPPGAYEFEFKVAASAARLPKELLWRIVCANSPYKIVAQAPIAPGTYAATTSRTELTVPESDCPLQTLQLVTKAIGENWNDRYSGSVSFDDFRISALDS